MPPASSLRLVGLLLLIVGLFRSRATGLPNLLCESAAGGRHPLCTSLVIDTVGLPTLLHERVAAGLPNLLHERSFAGLPNLLWSRCRAAAPAMTPHSYSRLPRRLVTGEYVEERELRRKGGAALLPVLLWGLLEPNSALHPRKIHLRGGIGGSRRQPKS
jgi:hypothetical protein